MALELRKSGPPRYSGLFAQQGAQRGQVLLTVPAALCLVVDYEQGLKLPSDGSWPNLVEGLDRPEPLPWDLLLALALVDAELGRGGSFWKEYAESVLPRDEELSLPFCFPPVLLGELQDSALRAGAEAQRGRLAAAFPSLAATGGGGLPSLLRSFACVRSRAFRASEDRFAFVPFLDAANHANDPNADFRCTGNGDWQLVAVKPIAEGDEVCISYAGEEGYTNRRFMAQYGFVPMGGNFADRIDLEADLGVGAQLLDDAAPLSGSRLQACVGESAFASMISGNNSYLFSAIKSLPIRDDEAEGPQAPDTGAALAEALLAGCKEAIAGFPTSLEEDEGILQRLLSDPERDLRALSAVVYRSERKKLLSSLRGLLERYVALQRPSSPA